MMTVARIKNNGIPMPSPMISIVLSSFDTHFPNVFSWHIPEFMHTVSCPVNWEQSLVHRMVGNMLYSLPASHCKHSFPDASSPSTHSRHLLSCDTIRSPEHFMHRSCVVQYSVQLSTGSFGVHSIMPWLNVPFVHSSHSPVDLFVPYPAWH